MSSNLIWSWDFRRFLMLYFSFHSFFLACFLVFSALKRVHAQIVQYAMRWEQLTLLFLDQIFCLGHTTGFKKVIIMASPVFSPSKQKPGCFLVLLVLTLCFCLLCLLTKISLFFSCTLCRTATNIYYYVKCLLFSTVF